MKARSKTASLAVHAVAWGCLLGVLSLFVVLTPCRAAMAQKDVNLPVAPAGRAEPTQMAATPALSEVTGNDVRIRSGPGTNFYQCGRLYRSDRVQVVKSSDGWSAIVPPTGSYSWIAVQYVSISVQNPTEGIITGDSVPVYAGSDELEPLVSTTKQDVALTRGQKVRLLGEAKDEYYKIAPPAGAYLWVSSQYLQPTQGQQPAVSAGGPKLQVSPAQTPPAVTPAEANLINEYYALTKQITEEQKKPLAQQDYATLKEKLKTLAENKDGGRAARYAQYTLRQVNRIELARLAGKELALQNKDLQESSERIDKALQERLDGIQDMGKYAVTGRLQPSALYAAVVDQPRRYQLVDESGNIKCYVAPAGAAAGKDLTPFIGHKVGLVGQIQPHAATARAFVEFSDIVRLD
jgi:uncharacterized protein YraI